MVMIDRLGGIWITDLDINDIIPYLVWKPYYLGGCMHELDQS